MHDGCAAGGEAVETGVGRRRVGTVDSRNEKRHTARHRWRSAMLLLVDHALFSAVADGI
jgi:hypothetical protein